MQLEHSMSFRVISAGLRAVRPHLPVKTLAATAIVLASAASAQEPTTNNESTVTYPASFFAQYEPFSVNDMLNRIPGINLALGGGDTGGPGSSQGSDRRGLRSEEHTSELQSRENLV